jgi:tetrahydromethanopterin S-methyltransferase subunit H
MFDLRFEVEQVESKIGGRVVGGQPGNNPPLMIGNMFWPGDKIVNSRKGKVDFDREEAVKQIRALEILEKKTGLPSLVDMVANTGDEMKQYIEFFVETTEESGMPFASDAYMTKVKRPAAEAVAELGQMDRYLYNSLSFWEKDLPKEIEEIAKLGVKHVVLGLWDAQDDFSTGRLKCLDKMWPLLEPYKFESILCDCSVMHLPTSMICNNAMRIIKEKHGLPAGSGPANGVYMWMKDAKELVNGDADGFKGVDVATEAVSSLGADWIMYGPIEAMNRIYPGVAIAQCNIAAMIMDEYKELPENPNHPFNLLFPDVVKEFHDKLAGVEKKRKWLRKSK